MTPRDKKSTMVIKAHQSTSLYTWRRESPVQVNLSGTFSDGLNDQEKHNSFILKSFNNFFSFSFEMIVVSYPYMILSDPLLELDLSSS